MQSNQQAEQGQRVGGLFVFVIVLFAILILRLFYLQVATSADYARESDENRIDRKRIKAPRGLILARGGEILAQNGAFYTISLMRTNRPDYDKAVAALKSAIGGPGSSSKYTLHRSIRLKRDVDFRAVSIVEEMLKEEWPLHIEIEAKRDYPSGSLGAHLLGYMGFVNDKEEQDDSYLPGDFIGRTGVEKLYEGHLRGKDGLRVIEVDAKHRIRREFPEQEQPAEPGDNLYLTIDFELQKAAEQALPDSVPGCVVALDAQTGAVLAMASKPMYDPNVFVSVQRKEERTRLLKTGTTLLNRAIAGTYPPGSTLKLVGAAAALESGITDTLSTFEACAGSLQVGDTVFRCFKRDGHGELNLLQAVEASCNIYFLHLAQLLGMETWWEFADLFGFGRPTGVNLSPGDGPGLLPSRQYYVEREGWTQGHLMNLVIGQGAMLATPIQMARYVATLGNGGRLVTPHVSGPAPPPRRIESISTGTFDVIKKCMLRVIYGDQGTGRTVALDGITLAGKSGTAQVPNRNDDAWFVAFAPYDDPTIAVAVVVEGGGGGGSVAGPIVRQVMASYFSGQAPAAGADSPTDG